MSRSGRPRSGGRVFHQMPRLLDSSIGMEVSTTADRFEVLVIGGGQAGLAMGYYLAERGLSFVIADANPEVGHAWRSRWQSLKLFTAGQYNNLPGMSFPAARDSYSGKDDVAEFLQSYAAKFELPVRLNTIVTRLSRVDDGGYVAETTTGRIEADQVVIATGPFQVPFTPPLAEQLDAELTQLHSASYRGPDDLPEGRALVVGGANSGQQIALELSDSRRVDIAVGQKLPTLPQRPLGRDIWWWLTTTRLARVPVSSRLGQRLSQRDVVIGGGLRELRRHGVGVRTRVTDASRRTVTFEGGESADYDGVVWATGFRIDHSWVEIPQVKDERGQVQHLRGVTESPGLYTLGMTWQYKRTSALLGWVGDDAAFLAEQIEAAKPPAHAEALATTTS
jgi:putative flavoprotein involved in K+ transport